MHFVAKRYFRSYEQHVRLCAYSIERIIWYAERSIPAVAFKNEVPTRHLPSDSVSIKCSIRYTFLLISYKGVCSSSDQSASSSISSLCVARRLKGTAPRLKRSLVPCLDQICPHTL